CSNVSLAACQAAKAPHTNKAVAKAVTPVPIAVQSVAVIDILQMLLKYRTYPAPCGLVRYSASRSPGPMSALTVVVLRLDLRYLLKQCRQIYEMYAVIPTRSQWPHALCAIVCGSCRDLARCPPPTGK